MRRNLRRGRKQTMEVLQLPEPQIEETAYQTTAGDKYHFAEEIEEEETLSLQEKEMELIKKSLETQ